MHVPKVVTSEMNERLLAAFTGDKVKAAVFDIHPTKAPGPDGFPMIFVHNTWNIAILEVLSLVLLVLNDGA